MEKVYFSTKDGVGIVGSYFNGNTNRSVLLLHMMPATKESWNGLAEKLSTQGFHVLAIDLRGHGESSGGPEGYTSFSDEEHQKSILDVEAGIEFLKSRGVNEFSIAGASIGANLALWYATEHREVQSIALLSSGLNYKGVETEPLVQKIQKGQRVLFAASKDDDRSGGNNVAMNKKLFSFVPEGAQKKLIIYESAGHGTNMFGKESPDLEGEIVEWLTQNNS